MSNIKILNDITVFNNITALSTVDVGNLIVHTSINSPEITFVRSASANWDNTYATVSSLSATWGSGGGGSGGSYVGALSVNWENTFNTVSSLSSDWNDTKTVMASNSGNWETAYSYIVATSANETQQQTNSANWDSTYTTVSTLSVNWNNVFSSVNATSANPIVNTFTTTVSGSTPKLAIGTTVMPDDNTELYVSGDVVITGNVSAAGSMTFTNTYFSTTSTLSVVNNGTGPTFVAVQYGDQPIAAFYDGENTSNPALWVDGALTRPGFVGINTKTPNTNLAISGSLSALSANIDSIISQSIVVTGNLSAGSYSPHNHTAAQVTDFYSAALSATKNQIIIYSMLFG